MTGWQAESINNDDRNVNTEGKMPACSRPRLLNLAIVLGSASLSPGDGYIHDLDVGEGDAKFEQHGCQT